MSRIHGENQITRRAKVVEETDYRKYRENLREDFFYICGYCGKLEQITKHGFEIDHFVPLSFDGTKETKYTNLVYSCFTCNRKKSWDWPTKDTNLHNDGKKGYVDPASFEYDDHSEKDEFGNIIAKTQVGKYMVKKFKFDTRPMKTIHKINMLLGKKKLLNKKIEITKKREELVKYYEIQSEIDNLMNIMFASRE